MDRLGDDLCQVLLSYLPFEDRFRCECVSKQWQRVVYKTQTEYTGKHILNVKSFEWILKKCQNISRIGRFLVSFSDNSMFELITKHCNHLQHICIPFDALSVDTIAKFFAKFAKSLKSIESCSIRENTAVCKCVDNCLKLCTNVTNLWSDAIPMSTVSTNDVLFPKLTKFETNKQILFII